ncbi:hypothetical protein [Leptolyngbya sp. PCC 6406]|uniref:hypothetical protein n=1 Tax=Leptolyngbya sp. PCC 6406 TaxID=1173264 RepID=UPI0002ABF41E|nr:hypothetical protein [Leptolyngbya sp. PCC 6406]
MVRHPVKKQIFVDSRYLLVVGLVFLILPRKAQVRALIAQLAAQQVTPPGQWAAIAFLSAIPLLILAVPFLRLVATQVQETRQQGLQSTWISIAALALALGALVTYCLVRGLYWIS